MITVKTIAATMSTTISTASIHVNGELVLTVGTGRASTFTILRHGPWIGKESITASVMQVMLCEGECALVLKINYFMKVYSENDIYAQIILFSIHSYLYKCY